MNGISFEYKPMSLQQKVFTREMSRKSRFTLSFSPSLRALFSTMQHILATLQSVARGLIKSTRLHSVASSASAARLVASTPGCWRWRMNRAQTKKVVEIYHRRKESRIYWIHFECMAWVLAIVAVNISVLSMTEKCIFFSPAILYFWKSGSIHFTSRFFFVSIRWINFDIEVRIFRSDKKRKI